MPSNNTKYYLRPFGFIPQKDLDLQNNKVIEVRGNHYSNIELIKKEKRRVFRTNYLVEDFYKLADNKIRAVIKPNANLIINSAFSEKNISEIFFISNPL